jgi:hypothetical protein
MGSAHPQNDSTTVIKEKANKAIQETGAGLTEHKVKVVSHLRNRGILLELDNEGAVKWLQEEETRKTFLGKIHTDATIKPRSFPVIIQFIPLTLCPENTKDICKIEECNNLKEGDITRARWIKPVAHRSPMQTCGHLIFAFSSARATNKTLANGLFIC